MVNGLLKRFSRSDYWKFMSWYRERFGFFPALSSYLKLWINRIGTAPNPLNGIAVKLRPATTDLHVYDEIFLAKEYDLDLGNPAFIVDAGAHIGLASVYFASRYPNATIIAVEPEPANFAMLLKNVKPFKNIIPIQAGLWSRKTHLRIEDSSVETWSFRVHEDTSGVGIPAIGIGDILSEFKASRIDVLKIDIEGSEIQVLNHSQAWIDVVDTMIIELHDRFQPGCTESLQNAVMNHRYDQSESGESLVLRNIRKHIVRHGNQLALEPVK
jgi:FkbM family methyltransferase